MPNVFYFEIEYESPDDSFDFNNNRIDNQYNLYIDLEKLHDSSETTRMGAANWPRIKYTTDNEESAINIKEKAVQLINYHGVKILDIDW